MCWLRLMLRREGWISRVCSWSSTSPSPLRLVSPLLVLHRNRAYTLALLSEDYVHRIGRTGRAGLSGKAITFYTGEAHEKSLAGEFKRVLRDAGAEIPEALAQMSGTIKKKEHGSYGAFYRDTSDAPAPKKIKFD